MKSLILHCKKFNYKLDHPTLVADPADQHQPAEFNNSLVVFFAVEKTDKKEKIITVANEIINIAKKVNPDSIVLNPFAHLSNSLAAPALAKEISQELFRSLKDLTTKEVAYTSFGWYKSFMADVYGHDDSQIFREF